MNNDVTAANMTVTAKAEDGIVIAAYTNNNATAPAASAFNNTINATIAALTDMLPTWTNNATTWYHAASTQSNNGQAYTTAGYADVTDDTTNNYYLYNKFQIKSTGTAQAVYVKSITVVSGGSQTYDEAIRVLIKSGDATLVFAPIGTHSGTETILAATATSDDLSADASFTFATVNKLAAEILSDVSSTPEDVSIYIFYDGEDAVCKSDNIEATFAGTTLNVVFTTDEPAD